MPEKASFTSNRSVLATVQPHFSRTRCTAPDGASRKSSGLRANCACATIRATGVAPSSRARSRDDTTSAAPPSFTFDALPAVIVPSVLKAGRSERRDSRLVSRGVSSLITRVTSPLRPFTSTAAISSSNQPSRCARSAFSYEPSANRSWSSRVVPRASATPSAHRPM